MTLCPTLCFWGSRYCENLARVLCVVQIYCVNVDSEELNSICYLLINVRKT